MPTILFLKHIGKGEVFQVRKDLSVAPLRPEIVDGKLLAVFGRFKDKVDRDGSWQNRDEVQQRRSRCHRTERAINKNRPRDLTELRRMDGRRCSSDPKHGFGSHRATS